MREILFKAKRIDNEEWMEGHYYSQAYHKGTIEEEWYHFIKPIGSESWESIRVNEATICQYTGLTDKNGNKIWENDVVRLPKLFSSEIGQVVYLAPSFKSYCKAYGYTQLCGEVIGNIFDNADLLEGE